MWGARQVEGLNALRKGLRTCNVEPIHKYASHLSLCPWCYAEKTGGAQFFLPFLLLSTGASAGAVNLAGLWAQIQSVTPPTLWVEYRFPMQSVAGEPPPADRLRARRRYVVLMPMMFMTLIGGLAIWPNLAVIWIGLGIFFLIGFRHPYTKQRRERKAVLESLKIEFDSKLKQYKDLSSIKLFTDLQMELSRVKAEVDRLEPAYQAERQKLRENIQSQQLQKHLERCFLSKAKIPGIGATRLAMLESFGVETAADIDQQKIIGIPSFGPKLTRDLLAWRRKMQANFKFNPQQGVDPRDEQQLLARFNQRRSQLHGVLQEGLSKLQRFKTDMTSKRSALWASLDQTSLAIQKAKADVMAVSKW